MEIRIGIVQSMKEIDVELADDVDRETFRADLDAALTNDGVLWLTDRKGRQVGVPAARIAFVEIGSSSRERVVGFGAV